MGTRTTTVVSAASALSAGTIVAVSTVLMEISFAALVFAGPLEPFIAAGIGYFLFATVVVSLTVALTSALPNSIGVAQDTPAVILAVGTAAIAAILVQEGDAESALPTVVATIGVTSLTTGAAFLALGRLRLANLVRYVPFPVVGGFLAGTGWLLTDGAVNVMTGSRITFAALPTLFDGAVLAQWLPGLALAVVALLVLRRTSHPLALPGLLLGATAVFHVVLRLAGMSETTARADGWLLGPFPTETLWHLPTAAMFQQVRWDTILAQSGTLGIVVLISLLAYLLNATGLELVMQRDVRLNREMQLVGVANVLGGLGGGPVGYQALSLSALSYRMTPDVRLTGVVVSALCGLVLLGGSTALAQLPTFVPGGILLYLGLDFLVAWLYDARHRLSRGEYAIVMVITVVMAVFGALEGVALGIFLAMVLFIVEYSRGAPIRRTYSGSEFTSNVDRPPAERRALHASGQHVRIFELQQHLFFGTAHRLLEAVRERVVGTDHGPRFVVLDFRHVTGLDASVASSFAKIGQLAETRGFTLVLTGPSVHTTQLLHSSGLVDARETAVRVFSDLDHGVEWCEDQVLMTVDAGSSVAAPADEGDGTLGGLREYMASRSLPAGARLIEQGQSPEGLYYLDAGLLTAQVEHADGSIVRLRKMRPGVFVGELSLYAGARASASVVADEPSTVLFLSGEDLELLDRDDPAMAVAFHRHIAALTSERLLDATTSTHHTPL
ncbi:MAG TPA: SulP family inorganic anion transporter [Euzebyales bacterium]